MPKEKSTIRTPDQPHYLNPAEAAALYGCSPRTIRRYIAAGTIRGLRLGPRMIRVDARELDTLLRPIPTVGDDAA